jgi:hypothetical protein
MGSEKGFGNAGLKDRIGAHLDRHHFRVRGNIEKVLAGRRAGFGRMAWSGATEIPKNVRRYLAIVLLFGIKYYDQPLPYGRGSVANA